uniref:Retrotransposon gag domain-containing protein n=1 Tax=Glossina morsitans morsitans TaxID=37546 RepID=A0A1B0GD97_GLOMM
TSERLQPAANGANGAKQLRRKVDLNRWHLKFDGSGKGLTVESFIFRTERFRQQQHLSHEDLFAEFHCLMAGQANKWYWQLMEDREGESTFDYFSLKAELLNQFKAADSDYELIREVVERKQQQSESFEDYYAEIHDLTFRLRRKIPEPELIKIMKSNVKPSLATLIFATKVGSVAELKAECKRAEKLLKENRTRPRHVNEVGQEIEASSEAYRQTVEAFAPRHDQASDNQFRERRQFQPATSRAGQPKQTTAPAGAPLEQHTLRQTRGVAANAAQSSSFCQSPFHLTLCYVCGMPVFEDIIDPENVEEALSEKTQDRYDTMYDEYSSLMKNRTWEIADVLKNRSTVGREWVLKSKIKPEKTMNGQYYIDKFALPARQRR